MKIMCVRPYADFSVADVAAGLIEGLRANGHTVEEYSLSKRLKMLSPGLAALSPNGIVEGPEAALLATEPLVYRALETGCEWTLIVCGGWVHPNPLAVYRALGGKVAIVFTEGPYLSHDDSELRLLKVCDVAFTNERTCLPLFQQAMDAAAVLGPIEGAPGRVGTAGGALDGRAAGAAYYLPHSYDPTVHNQLPAEPPLEDDEHVDVLFLGTGFTERQRWLEQVDWSGINLGLGGLWPGITMYGEHHVLKPSLRWSCIFNADLARLYKGCKIVLNLHRWAEEGAGSLGPRTYEVAACGAFQICDDTRGELQDVFGNSVPTVPYGVPWRLEAEIRKWLADDAGREAKAAEANRRVQGLTFENRSRFIVEAIERFDVRRATTQHSAAIPPERGSATADAALVTV